LLPGQDLFETASIKSTIGTNRYGRETNDEETIEHRFAVRNGCEIKEEKRVPISPKLKSMEESRGRGN